MKTLAREEPKITKKLVRDHGLTDGERQKIIKLLGREPTFTELGIFSVMWSEHCSYKSSKIHLRKFPTKNEIVVQGPGENAGAIDIGDGLAAVFKMESHNHPSFIEPYQGAATGVGGILRDIFTMGARPVALLNSLRFGPLQPAKNRFLFEGVVSGIADYGNCMGVPTVGGEIYFSECYNLNPLVNAFCLGILKKDAIFKGNASGIGNSVIYVGSKTGRDGIHGVTMASEEFDDSSEAKRPNVQVGDPFTEKLLLEACLEVMKKGLIVGIQDMGGAGLTSSSSEMAGRAGTGIEIDTSLVPAREEGMIPYEIMLSESQERMLIVAEKDKEREIFNTFKKWDLDAIKIGKVTGDGKLRIKYGKKIFAEIPVEALTEEAPVYERPIQRPKAQDEINFLDINQIYIPDNLNDALIKLLSSPTIANKAWVYEQYDHMVRTNTILIPGSDAAVIRIKDTSKALAITTDCNSRYCYLDPYKGGVIAVAEAARNLVCSGAKPLAITDCLNFGNPEKPEIMWQFEQSVQGISDACRAFNTPVISGNVSFYNDTKGVSIFPTPIIGMVGIILSAEQYITQYFKDEDDIIILLGSNKEELGGSEYLKVIHDIERGNPPEIDLNLEVRIQRTLLDAHKINLIKSAHDCSEGGLAVTLSESCISNKDKKIGAVIDLNENMRTDALLFGETQSRIIITASPAKIDSLKNVLEGYKIPYTLIGKVGGERLIINNNSSRLIDISIDNLNNAWRDSIRNMMNKK
ncbi:MAG: phosphoribosylformylglycinamidine synthase subunit PurL [Nitrospirota bacterium]